jgi:outer membrane protein assembly factor BamB
VFAVFPTGELVALTLKGKRVWAKHLGVPENHYGHSSSLLTHDGVLYVQYDHGRGKLLALDNVTGRVVWEVERKRLSWSSPVCVNTGSRWELILVDNEWVTSYAPDSGTVLWSHDCMYGEVAPSPAYSSGRVFVVTEYSPAAAIHVPGTAAGDSSRILWRWDGELPSTASPVAADAHVFFASAGGTLSCVDVVTGKSVWTKDFDNGFYSSPVIAGARVYAIDRKGITRIFRNAGKYEELGSPPLGETCVTTPALLDGLIVVRGEKHLFCIDGNGEG